MIFLLFLLLLVVPLPIIYGIGRFSDVKLPRSGLLGVLLLAVAGWLLLWPQIARTITLYQFSDQLDGVWTLTVSRGAWYATLALLLLSSCLFLADDNARNNRVTADDLGLFALLPSALLMLWSTDAVSFLLATFLMIVSWSLTYFMTLAQRDWQIALGRARWLLLTLAPALLLAMPALEESSNGVQMVWQLLLLLGMGIMLGVPGLNGWRPSQSVGRSPTLALLHLVPMLGASQLARIAFRDIPSNGSPLIPIMILLAFFIAILQACRLYKSTPSRALLLILTAQALFFLFQMGSQPADMVANYGLLLTLLMGGLLLAFEHQLGAWTGRFHPTQLPLYLTLFLLALSPFALGPALSLLTIVQLLLQIGAITLILLIFWSSTPRADTNSIATTLASITVGLLAIMGIVISALWGQSAVLLGIGTVAALGGGLLAGVIWTGRLNSLSPQTDQLLDQLAVLTTLKQWLTESGQVVSRMIRQANALLEGEGGLLWLLVLLVVFGLARL